MDGRDLFISLGVIIITFFIASSVFMGPGTSIANAVSDKYPLINSENGIRIYSSNSDIKTTANNIASLKKPYDQKVDTSNESILLYDEAVVVVKEQNGTTEIEVIEDHQTAYNRHHSTMVLFWGSNLYQNGRIRTPRSIRQGSIGSSPSSGGGFGFGK